MKVYILEKCSPAGDLLARTYYPTQRAARKGLRHALYVASSLDHLNAEYLGQGKYYVWNPSDLSGWYLNLVEAELPDDSLEARFWRVRWENG